MLKYRNVHLVEIIEFIVVTPKSALPATLEPRAV
jgi:hypothetical protein